MAGLSPNREDRSLFYPNVFSGFYLPYNLFTELCIYGAKFKGQQVDFIIVNTTGDSIRDYYGSVWWATWITLWRHQKRYTDSELSKYERKIQGKLVMKHNQRTLGRFGHVTDLGHMIKVRTSRCSHLVKYLRGLWGDHTVWRLDLPSVQGIATLKAFQYKKPTFINTVKQNILFCRPMVSLLSHTVYPCYGNQYLVPSNLIHTMIAPGLRLNYVWYGMEMSRSLL